jgi:nucleoside 2-deoxyribosyltransferase
MRGKEYLKDIEKFDGTKNYGSAGPLSGDRAITTRDRRDATTCDVLLANVLGADKASIGTVLEIAWADSERIPIVLVMEPEGNPHDHAMLRELAGFRVATLDEALWIAARVLNASEPWNS